MFTIVMSIGFALSLEWSKLPVAKPKEFHALPINAKPRPVTLPTNTKGKNETSTTVPVPCTNR